MDRGCQANALSMVFPFAIPARMPARAMMSHHCGKKRSAEQ